MKLVDYLNDLTNTRSIEELWNMHCEKMAGFGFNRLLYGFTNYRVGKSLGDPEDFIILTNHKQNYVDWFFGESEYFNAPMVKWALENEGSTSWQIIKDMVSSGVMTKAEMRVFEANRDHKVTCGYTISFKSVSPRSKGAIALTGREDMTQDDVDAIWDEHSADLILMNNITHLKIISMPYFGATRGLTKRQLEALHWVGDGKTAADIALLMGLTPATVEKHLRLARNALSVETTAQAVLKAAFQKQMFVVEY